jgi:hypothetical protein
LTSKDPEQARHVVGAQHPYCGALGERANCQATVSVHYAGSRGHYPLDLRVYWPDSWLTDPRRLDRAGAPAAQHRALTKPESLDRVRGEGLPGWAVVTDAGYGASADFRGGVAARGLAYLAGVTGDFVAFAEAPTGVPRARRGGADRDPLPAGAREPPPVALSEPARRVRLRKETWWETGLAEAQLPSCHPWPGQRCSQANRAETVQELAWHWVQEGMGGIAGRIAAGLTPEVGEAVAVLAGYETQFDLHAAVRKARRAAVGAPTHLRK